MFKILCIAPSYSVKSNFLIATKFIRGCCEVSENAPYCREGDGDDQGRGNKFFSRKKIVTKFIRGCCEVSENAPYCREGDGDDDQEFEVDGIEYR